MNNSEKRMYREKLIDHQKQYIAMFCLSLSAYFLTWNYPPFVGSICLLSLAVDAALIYLNHKEIINV